MSNSAYNQGANDASRGLGPKDVRNQPATVQNAYNAGYNNSKK